MTSLRCSGQTVTLARRHWGLKQWPVNSVTRPSDKPAGHVAYEPSSWVIIRTIILRLRFSDLRLIIDARDSRGLMIRHPFLNATECTEYREVAVLCPFGAYSNGRARTEDCRQRTRTPKTGYRFWQTASCTSRWAAFNFNAPFAQSRNRDCWPPAMKLACRLSPT